MVIDDTAATTTIDLLSAAQEFVVRILREQFHDKTAGEIQQILQHNAIQTWLAPEFSKQFDVTAVLPPYVRVTDKETGKQGTIMFVDEPRVYFSLMEYDDD